MAPNNPQLDRRPLCEAGINYASRNHIPTVVADRGNYYFLTTNGDYHHAVLNDVNNVTVDLQNSDLFFALGSLIAIHVVNSGNVTLKNFTIDYLQLPYTELTVTGVIASTKTISIKTYSFYDTVLQVATTGAAVTHGNRAQCVGLALMLNPLFY